MSPEKITKVFERLKTVRPDPQSELIFTTPYELLVAIMLSAQATDASVNKATAKLYPIANTAEKIVALGVDGLKEYVKTINLYPTKAKNIIRMSEILLEKHHGNVPDSMTDLVGLPGVGRKTANVVLNTAFHQPTIAVDTHIFRVSNRTGIAPGKNVQEVEKNLLATVPETYRLDAHHWLLLHGRYVCLSRRPKCDACGLQPFCRYCAAHPVDAH